MIADKKFHNQGIWIRCSHCKRKFRSWEYLWNHWRLFCKLKPPGVPSIISVSIESTLELILDRDEYNVLPKRRSVSLGEK